MEGEVCMKADVINIDPIGCVSAVKEKNGKCTLHYTVDDFTYGKLEISPELFEMIAREFGETE